MDPLSGSRELAVRRRRPRVSVGHEWCSPSPTPLPPLMIGSGKAQHVVREDCIHPLSCATLHVYELYKRVINKKRVCGPP